MKKFIMGGKIMKKLLAFLVVLTMLIGIMPVVSADTSGYVSFTDISVGKNAGCTVYSDSDPDFDYVRRVDSTGTAKIYVRGIAPCSIASGEYVYVTFYYKTLSDTAPSSFYAYGTTESKSSGKTQFGYANTAGAWSRAEFFIPAGQAYASGANVNVYMVMPSSSGKVMYVADAKMVYTGASNDTSALETTAITSLTVGGTKIDLAANPDSCTAANVVDAADVVVTTTYGDADKVTVTPSEDGKALVVKVYAPAIDYRGENVTPTATYTVNQPKASEFTFDAQCKINSANVMVSSGIKPVSDENVWIDVLTGEETAGTNFDTIYTFNIKEGSKTVDGDISTSEATNFIFLASTFDDAPVLGDYVYVKFYARAMETYTDENGNTVNGEALRMYPRISNNQLKIGSANFFNTTYEWVEYEYLVNTTQNMVNEEQYVLRFANIPSLTKNNDESGKVVSTTGNYTNAQIQIAGIQVINFGKPIVTSGSPSDTEINNKIDEMLSTCGLTGIYRSDSEDNLYDKNTNPLIVSTGPRYIANTDKVKITGDTIFGKGTAEVIKNGNEYTFVSYAPNYDFINNTGNKEEFTLTVTYDYDFYGFAFDDNAFTLKADNCLTTSINGVIIGASYDAMGKMLKLKAEPFSINGLANTLSVTVPEATGVASYKFFVWDSVASGKPYVKTIVVDNITTGNISQ